MKKFKFSDYLSLFDALKIAFGCVISILISSYLGMKYGYTSGLITILSIQNTKKETIFTALKRFGAFFAAMILAECCFRIIGFNVWAFGVYIFIFVLFCYKLEWKSAIVPISVLVTHILGEESLKFALIANEFMIFFIGAGMGIIINMHLHKDIAKMEKRRRMLDEEIKNILERMSKRVLTDDKTDYNDGCFETISHLMFEAEQTANENRNNAFSSQTYDEDYLKMRRNQCSVLYEMYKSVVKMNATPKQAVIISEFLRKVSEEYHETNNVKNLLFELEEIFDSMRNEKMPKSRMEFENRAVLYSLMLQTKEFLNIKYVFMNSN